MTTLQPNGLHVLVVDDEVTTCRETVKLLKRLGYESSYLLDLEKVERWITLHQPDILLLDVEFPGDMNGGINLLQALRRAGHLHPAIFLSHRGDSGTVVDASRQGMVTYLEKSASESALVAALEEAKGALPHRFDPDLPASEQVLGASAAFRETMQICRDFAPLLDIPVLLTGETGCGKNLTARLIHQLSPLCDKPFMELTCPTIPEGLAESHLFGHLKGSFTHAIADQKGIFELADGGTLFLDEFGDLKPDVQLKLLRVLDSGEYTVLGEHRTRHSRVRLIVATNQDIPAKIQNGEFRADLWHRIQGLELHLPPLRERSEDIALLANYFVARFISGKPGRAHVLSPDALRALQRHDWPGNIRELDYRIKNICARSKTIGIEAWQVENALPAPAGEHTQQPKAEELPLPTHSDKILPWKEYKTTKEREYFDRIVELTGGNIKRAAELAGVDRKKIYEVRGTA